MGLLEGRRVLIVGASSGIGRCCAQAFVAHGANVAFTARRKDLLDAAIAEAGGGHAVALDVTDAASISSGVDQAAALLGGIDVVLYTAGMSPLGRLTSVTPEQWQTIFAINTFGANLVFAAALAHSSSDAIFSAMSSDSAMEPRHSLVPYAASKAALEATMQGWRTEEIGGRRFMTIVVGPTQPTGFADHFDMSLLPDVYGHWQRQGMRTGIQNGTDVAQLLAASFSSLLAAPTLGMDTLLVRAPEPAAPIADFGASTNPPGQG